MRLWRLHPCYLDAKGLVALWREGLLAQKVLCGKTKGYRHHPQLERFKAHPKPKAAVAAYLKDVHSEAARRGYAFDASKIQKKRTRLKIKVTRGQLDYEFKWLRRKLKTRDPEYLRTWKQKKKTLPHPLFKIISGKVASWEKI